MTTRNGDRYDNYTTSFSGTDMTVSFVFPEAAPVIVGTATTLAYSIYRQLAHVRTLGRITSKGYARGGRTCGGTIIFTVIKESIVEDFRKRVSYLGEFKSLKPDELPPFDIILTFGNEFGQTSTLIIYGVSIVDETKTLSVEDIFTENVFTFLARDIQHMKNGEKFIPATGTKFRGQNENLGKFTLAELIATAEDEARKKRLEDIARAEAERHEFPVHTDPSTAPSDSSGGGSSGGGDSSSGGQVTVFVQDTDSKAVSGATVWYTDSSGKKTSGKTDSKGVWKTPIKLGASFTFYATKSGYSEGKVNHKTTKGQPGTTVTVKINKVLSGGGGGHDPDAKESVVYVDYASPSKYKGSENGCLKIDKEWVKGKGPKLKLTNGYGEPLNGYPVEVKFNIPNYKDCPFLKLALFKGAWPKASGYVSNKSGRMKFYTDTKGLVELPILQIHRLFDGAYIDFTVEPFIKKDTSEGKVSKKMFKTFSFLKDNGGL